MLTGQKESVDENQHDNQLLELLTLANGLALEGELDPPLGLLIACTAAFFLVLLALAGGSPPAILARW